MNDTAYKIKEASPVLLKWIIISCRKWSYYRYHIHFFHHPARIFCKPTKTPHGKRPTWDKTLKANIFNISQNLSTTKNQPKHLVLFYLFIAWLMFLKTRNCFCFRPFKKAHSCLTSHINKEGYIGRWKYHNMLINSETLYFPILWSCVCVYIKTIKYMSNKMHWNCNLNSYKVVPFK